MSNLNHWLTVSIFLGISLAVNAAPIKYTYDGAGRLIKADFGEGVTLTYSYDKNGNMVSQSAASPVGFSLPFYQADAAGFNGFAVSNFSARSARLAFTAFGPNGAPLPFAKNPAEFILESKKQLARLGHEIFGVDASTRQSGWIKMTSDNAEIGSFFMAGGGTQLDGSVAFTQQSKKLFFTRAFEGAGAFRGQAAVTFISIGNPNDHAIGARLTLFGPGIKETVAQTDVTIAAKGVFYNSLSEIFGRSLAVSNGFVEVEVTQGDGAVGFELVQLKEQNTIIGLNASLGNSSNQSYSAQLAHGQLNALLSLFTDVRLINAGGQARAVTLTAVSENGLTLGTPARLNLAAGEHVQKDAGELFSLGAAPPVVVGSIRMEADGPGLIGDVIFGDPVTFSYAAALPLQFMTFTRAVFSQVASTQSFFTGLAFYYPGNATANITIEVFTEEGVLTGSSSFVLASGKRISRLIQELVPAAASQVRGYVVVRSTQPLVAQQLFGTFDLSLLSAVPPTLVH